MKYTFILRIFETYRIIIKSMRYLNKTCIPTQYRNISTISITPTFSIKVKVSLNKFILLRRCQRILKLTDSKVSGCQRHVVGMMEGFFKNMLLLNYPYVARPGRREPSTNSCGCYPLLDSLIPCDNLLGISMCCRHTSYIVLWSKTAHKQKHQYVRFPPFCCGAGAMIKDHFNLLKAFFFSRSPVPGSNLRQFFDKSSALWIRLYKLMNLLNVNSSVHVSNR